MRLQHRLALVLTAVVVAAGFAAVGPATTAQAAAPTTGRYTPLDTVRSWTGTVRTTPTTVQLGGRTGVPATATAVVVNVEVENPTAAGSARVTPAGVSAGVTTQAFRKGQTVSSLQTVRLAGGKVQVQLTAGAGTVYLDVSGYYANGSGATFTPLNAARVFNKRVGTTPTKVPLAGHAGIPSTATAVALNTEVGTPSANGYVRVTPAGKDARVAAQVFTKGTTISNLVIVKLAGGAAQVKVSSGTATVFMDVAGYYANTSTGSVFVPVNPVRAASTTLTTTPRQIRLSGTAGVPGTATAIVATATTSRTTAASYLRFTPAGQDPQVATQVLGAGQTLSNAVMTKLVGSTVDRRVQAKVSAGTAALTVDVAGYFMSGASGSGFGADISWPQCGAALPTGQAFGVVGANGSLVNQSNPCVAQQLKWAAASVGGTNQPKAQVYALAANPGRAASVWPKSSADPAGTGKTISSQYGVCTGAYDAACSYMYGYTRAYEATHSRGVPTPSAYRWWVDVETGLSWLKSTDAKDYQAQNRADIEGMVAALKAAKVSTVGIYSTKAQFNTIVGSVPANSPLTGLPSWIAVGTDGVAAAQAACSAGGLTTGSRVQMAQYVVGAQDQNVTCV
ncbi:hypothetical protein DEJ28_11765 [Curtobacterium sp. MCPF17_002]|uniref:hypothetical protein n=1 Tax=Curtobacterium sp. MCPF17_002 TaxID=2175645 RepID=UPI000DAABF88|nr:hypothetical protein [Curtobacterium sp. MCPF17_002]WIB76341.1 hypothetical protein DEJ28_11765 [Curtobacterium sp. MCPF17_002]